MADTARELRPREEIEPGATDSLGKIARMIQPGTRVLDLGTARGALGRWLSQQGCTADGVEQDARLAEVARPHYRHLHRADLETVELAELVGGETYDVVVCADVLEHLRTPEKTLEQIRGLLRPGGELLISVPNVGYIGIVLDLLLGRFDYRAEGLLDQSHVRFFTRKSLVELLGRTGFAVLSIETVLVELNRSEFRSSAPERLDPALLAALRQRPDGAVYQFIIRATPGTGATTESLVPDDHPEMGFHTQVYWKRNEEPYDEARSSSVFLNHLDSRHRISFRLPPGTRGVRWDPLDRPGIVSLHRMELVTPDGAPLWSSDGSELATRAPASPHIRWLTTTPPVAFLALAGDPWIELPAPGDLETRGETEVRLDFSVIASEEGTRIAEAARRAEERTGGALENVEEMLRDLGRRTRLLEEEANSARVDRTRLEGMVAGLGGAVQGVTAALAQLAAQVERAGRVQEVRLNQLAELGREHARQLELGTGPALVRRMLGALRGGRVIRSVRFELVPLVGVEALSSGWRATTSDPELELRPLGGKFPRGSVLARYELDVDVDEASLYLDLGNGFDEAHRIALPRGRVELPLELPDQVRALRLDPRESPGAFRLDTFSLTGAVEVESVGGVLRGLADFARRR